MIKLVTQHSYFEKKPNKQMGRFHNNPSIGWVHTKSTHVHPLAWGNNNIRFAYRNTMQLNKPKICKDKQDKYTKKE